MPVLYLLRQHENSLQSWPDMWERIREIIIKELRQTFREPRLRTLLIVPPVMQLIVFGFAVNLDVENVKLAWLDQDRTPESRELISGFEGSERFHITATPASDEEIRILLDSGKVAAALQVVHGFAEDLHRNRTAEVQLIIDGTNSNTASLVSSYAGEIISTFAQKQQSRQRNLQLLVRNIRVPANFGTPSVIPVTRVWFNPDLKSRFYFVPGVLVNIIMIITVMLTAMAIVREKEIGTMEQLM